MQIGNMKQFQSFAVDRSRGRGIRRFWFSKPRGKIKRWRGRKGTGVREEMGANRLSCESASRGAVVSNLSMYLTTVASCFRITKDLSYNASEPGTIRLFTPCCLVFLVSLSLRVDAGYSPDNHT